MSMAATPSRLTSSAPCTNMCSIAVTTACALIPRLSLTSALGERREMLGRPVAVAPEPGGPQIVGEASGAAEAFGVRAGMRLAEALSRCPALALVAADPVRAEAVWERSLRRMEGLGAAVEPARPGEAFFALEPLCGLYGSIAAVLARARRALGPPARLGAGPNRLCAHAAATRMRARRPAVIVTEPAARRLLAGLPVAALRDRLRDERRRGWEEAAFIDSLERLGVRTLGELAALPAEAVADRFGEPGLRALRLARGVDEPLRPRRPNEELVERLGLPEAASGQQLERALGLLIERLLAHPARAGRTIRRLRLEARLAAGGGWRSEVVLRAALASPERLRLAITPRLGELPGPATSLALRALELGPEAGDQAPLRRSPSEERRGRLGEAVRQARAAAGRDAILQVIEVDPRSRVPERRAILTPFPDGADG
jgi:nucleotidyltransferase/DNA polymerase involved in DNA repair